MLEKWLHLHRRDQQWHDKNIIKHAHLGTVLKANFFGGGLQAEGIVSKNAEGNN